MMVRFLGKVASRAQGHVFAGLGLALLILSFPTFLAHNHRVSTDAYYPHDYASANFVFSVYGNGSDMKVFHYGDVLVPLIYSGVREAEYHGVWEDRNEANVWKKASELMEIFLTSKQREIFINSQRGKGSYQHILGVKPNDPRWSTLDQSLQRSHEVYDNGYVQIYSRTQL
jgi:hypothetical protein